MVKNLTSLLAVGAMLALPQMSTAKVDNFKKLPADVQQAILTQKATPGMATVAKDAPVLRKAKTIDASVNTPFAKSRKSFTVAARQYQSGAVAQTAALSPVVAYVNYATDESLMDYFHAFSPETGDIVETLAKSPYIPSTGGAIIGDSYYTVEIDDSYSFFGIYFFGLVSYNAETMENTGYMDLGMDLSNYVLAMTGYNDMLFAETYNADGSGQEFALFDPATGARTKVADTDFQAVCMTSATNGTIYALSMDGALYTINGATGECTKVSDVALNYASMVEGYYNQSMAYDDKSNTIYWFSVNVSTVETALYKMDPATAALTLVKSDAPNQCQVFGAVVPQPAAADAAPAAADALAANFANGALTGTITFTMPTETFAGEALTAGATYTVTANGETIASAQAAAGEAVTIDATLNEGTNLIVVTSANEAGVSPKAKTSVYVGLDTPVAPANVALSISDEGQATLTWDASAVGVHGGYLGDITYNVYRGAEQVAAALTATTFTETLTAPGMTNYVYSVEAVNGTKVSAAAASNGVVYGKALELPVDFDFANSQDGFAMSTVVDCNNDGRTWSYVAGTGARYTYSAANVGDDWLILPKMKLIAGRKYVLTHLATSYSSSFPERMEVKMGKAATAEAMTQTLVGAYVPELSTTAAAIETEFSVAEDGDYCIGFHAISDPDMFYLHLHSVSVEMGPDPQAPGAVTDYNIVVGEEGHRTASIAFTLPTTNVAGEALTAPITKVVVARDGQAIETLEGDRVNHAMLIVHDRNASNGAHNYTVSTYNAYGVGSKSAVETAYIGFDAVPMAPEATLTDQKTSVLVEWEPVPTVGANGGYVDPADVTYELYTVADGYIGELLTSTKNTSYTYTLNTDEGAAELLQLAMRTVTSYGTSGYMGTDAIVVGEPAGLPYVENFANGGISNFMWLQGMTNAGGQWGLATTDDAADNGGCATYSTENGDEWYSLATGKISVKGASNPQLMFQAKTNKNATIQVVAETRGGNETVIGVVPAKTTKWESFKMDLNQFKGEDYVMIKFKAVSEPKSGGAFSVYTATAAIDEIQVRDLLEHNLVVSLEAPAKVEKGQTVDVKIIIANEGEKDAAGYKVVLSCNDEVVAQATETPAIPSFAKAQFTASLPTSIFSEEDALVLEATAEYAQELKEDDNVDYAEVVLTTSTAAPVSELAATAADGQVVLTWVAPEASAEELTESFETYENLTAFPYTKNPGQETFFTEWNQVGQLGEWTAYDLDGGSIYGWNSTAINWPYMGDAMAFCVIDPEANGLGAEMVYAGKHSLMCMDIAPAGTAPHNDDWLISPELPGVAQTISFWVTELTGQYGNETFEVYYSTTDKEVASFTKIANGEASEEYQQFSYDLPEGTKFFAIRVTSTDAFAMIIDDIKYLGGSAAPVSFNVYGDKVKVANVAEATYTATAPLAETYSVTAVYASGKESAPVSVKVGEDAGNTTAIENLMNNAKAAQIYTIDGVRQHSMVEKGLYISNGKKAAVK